MDAYRRSASNRVSLVDHTSFIVMRSLGISRAFAFDDDFAREGFALVT
jgi:predicted nucleic acid-binding protein